MEQFKFNNNLNLGKNLNNECSAVLLWETFTSRFWGEVFSHLKSIINNLHICLKMFVLPYYFKKYFHSNEVML